MQLPFRGAKEGQKREKKPDIFHRGVLVSVLEAVKKNWKLGASDEQVEDVTGA
jgi:hypothetical protein